MATTLKVKDLAATIALLIVSVVMYSATFTFGRLTVSQIGPDFAPRIVAIAMFVLSAVLLFQTLLDWKKAKKLMSGPSVPEHEKTKEEKIAEEMLLEGTKVESSETRAQRASRYRNVLITTGLIALYIAVMPIIGFLISTIVYLFVQFCLLAQRKYWNIPIFAILAILTSVVIYYTFRLGFELRLPSGIAG
ncbi:tripartite tricarboxylate transporter TctB family protein [Alteribacillus sp. HJP-4]|uniref:tripartite tricarboxylate transporter TctB family protein n=1 Tax=Alteribacillus sp. HJP-4 TaxID=2775394 RepID=UPI0035CCF4C4